jgi:nicotinamide riboside kinase
VRLYERLVPATDYFSDGQKHTMLQTAVHTFQELCQVKATAAMLKVHHDKDIDYEGYISLLLSTASDYDSKNLVSKNKRQVYQHDMVDYYDDVINKI